MSLHTKPTHEALQRLRAQQRKSTISSIVIAVLVVILIALVFALILLPQLVIEAPTIVTYESNLTEDSEMEVKKVSTSRELKPSSPSSSIAKVIAANMSSPTAVPVPDFDVTTPSLDFGLGDDFGDGWGGDGSGTGGGGGGGFGSSSRNSGGMEGWLYDFKKKPSGKDISYNLDDRAEFVDRVLRLHRTDFSESSLGRHFRAPKSLFLTHLAIPGSNADDGPRLFGADIKPSGWIAHYHGRITVPKAGTYRFSGLGDDYLMVMINRNIRLVACWPDIQEKVQANWDPSEPTGSFNSPFGETKLVFGDWVNMRQGETLDFHLCVGERPGGLVGFVLQIEEKGVEYRKAANGRPILPLFTTAPFPEEEKSRVSREFGSYEFEWANVPVFRVSN